MAANNSITVTDEQIRNLAAELFALDQNNVRNIITVAAQGRGTGCPGLASDRLDDWGINETCFLRFIPINL